MRIEEAQDEVRRVFLGGFAGQLVSGVLWGVAAALGTWATPRLAIITLFFGGVFIFPLTQLLLHAMEGRASLSAGNRLGGLATQIAFTVPLNLTVAAAVTLYRLNWFFPACMVVVGTHYLPFVFLYGMWQFAVLAAALVGGGIAIALFTSGSFALGGWLTAAALIAFAFVGRAVSAKAAPRESNV